MDIIWCGVHTTNPPIIIAPISDTPILETFGSPGPTTPSPDSPEEAEDTDSPNPFNTGKKVRRKKDDKSEAIVNLMMQGLEIKESELEERKKEREEQQAILARHEEREQKLVDFMEILVKHIVREQ